MDVNFYCELSAPHLGYPEEQKRELSNFLLSLQATVQPLFDAMVFVWYKSPLSPEPPDLPKYSEFEYDELITLTVPLTFQYFSLADALPQIELLMSVFQNLCNRGRIQCSFEYHLE